MAYQHGQGLGYMDWCTVEVAQGAAGRVEQKHECSTIRAALGCRGTGTALWG